MEMKDLERINAILDYYPRLSKVRMFVEVHLDQPLTLARIAPIAHMEAKSFSKYFSRKTGVRLIDWLTTMRIAYAIEQFRSVDVGVTTVALSSGYRSIETFTRAFKRLTGQTPSEFKKAVQNEVSGHANQRERLD